MYDVIIIGAGVSGAATARELSRYKVKACVIEKEEDVCCGTSKANSAIVHAGYDAAEGSLMAKLNVRGNQMMEQLSKDLDFPFKKNGSLVVCLHEEDMPNLQALYDRGVANGVKELRIPEKQNHELLFIWAISNFLENQMDNTADNCRSRNPDQRQYTSLFQHLPPGLHERRIFKPWQHPKLAVPDP